MTRDYSTILENNVFKNTGVLLNTLINSKENNSTLCSIYFSNVYFCLFGFLFFVFFLYIWHLYYLTRQTVRNVRGGRYGKVQWKTVLSTHVYDSKQLQGENKQAESNKKFETMKLLSWYMTLFNLRQSIVLIQIIQK